MALVLKVKLMRKIFGQEEETEVTRMSQIAVFFLRDAQGGQEELTDGGCSGALYTVIWSYIEEELDTLCRTQPPENEEALDCVVVEETLARQLLEALPSTEAALAELAAAVAADWALSADLTLLALQTLIEHLRRVRKDIVLYYALL